MKTITTTAIVALMTATLGLSAIAPSYAQDAAPTQAQQQPSPGFGFRHDTNGGPRQFIGGDLLGFDRGVEAVEIALVRLSHAVELTAEQQALFDTLKADALAAAETFSTAVEGLRPAASAEGQVAEVPDFSERLENRIAIETARLAALEAVQPAVTTFFDSLTDEQKAELTPQRPDRGFMPGFTGKGGPRHHQGGLAAPHQGGPSAQGLQGHGGPGAPAPAETPATNG